MGAWSTPGPRCAGWRRRVRQWGEGVSVLTCVLISSSAQEEVRGKVSRVLQREFGRSLRDKEDEVEEIDQRLDRVRKALQVVRYAVVADYYAGGNLLKVRLAAPRLPCPFSCHI